MTAPAQPGKTVARGDKPVRPSLVEIFADRHTLDPPRLLAILRATAFKVAKTDPPATDEEIMQLLTVSNHYGLSPFLKEIYAFRAKGGGIVPIIGFDGWIKLVEKQPAYKGCEFTQGYDTTTIGGKADSPERGFYYEVTMHRSDRNFPTVIREYLNENYRNTDPWNDMPNRMTRMRAYIQCARVTFGFGGIYDHDEGEVVSIGTGVDYMPNASKPGAPRPAAAKTAEEPFINDDQLEQVREKLAKTGVPDNLVLAKFEVGTLEELRFSQFPDVQKFIQDNAP